MQSYSARKRSRSIAALIFLTLVGVGFFLFSLVAITCGFIINYHEDFKATDGGENLESKLEAEFDYSQYWLGLPLLLTAILSIASGTCQKRRSLTTTTIVSFHVCIVLALFAIVLEGVDWVFWKNLDREQRMWDNKNGYECVGSKTSCVCNSTTFTFTKLISDIASCSNISALSGLYGGIVASAITGIFLSLAGIVIILKSLSWKPRDMYMEYDPRKISPQQFHESSFRNQVYGNGIPKKDPSALVGVEKSGKSMTLYRLRDVN